MNHEHNFVYYKGKDGVFLGRLCLFNYYRNFCELKRKYDLLQDKFIEVLHEAKAYRQKCHTLQSEMDQAVEKAEPELYKYLADSLKE